MPFHPLGIAVLGTLAVVSTGVAFKKLVYDPHLAPVIEAYIAQLQALHRDQSTEDRHAIAMPVHAHRGSLSARDGWDQARRQLNNRVGRGKEDEAVADKVTGRDLYHGTPTQLDPSGNGLRNRRRSQRASGDHGAMKAGYWGAEDVDRQRLLGDQERESDSRKSVYPLPRPTGQYRQPSLSSASGIDKREHLIDLGPVSPQEAEIRSVIFNYPASTLASGRSTPALSRKVSEEHLSALGGMATLRPAGAYAPQVPSQLAVPLYNDHDHVPTDGHAPHDLAYPQPSTTFSFLSLSGASSPAVPISMLGSWHATSAQGASPMSPAGQLQSMHELQFPTLRAVQDLEDSQQGEGDSMTQSVPDLRNSQILSPGRVGVYHRALSDSGGRDGRDGRDAADQMSEYDVLSLPDTAHSAAPSSYADPESYTPNASRAHSPSFPSFPSVPSIPVGQTYQTSMDEQGAGELGLTFMRSPRGAPLSLAALQLAERSNTGYGQRNTVGNRRPLSVISLDESEAGRSEWEAI